MHRRVVRPHVRHTPSQNDWTFVTVMLFSAPRYRRHRWVRDGGLTAGDETIRRCKKFAAVGVSCWRFRGSARVSVNGRIFAVWRVVGFGHGNPYRSPSLGFVDDVVRPTVRTRPRLEGAGDAERGRTEASTALVLSRGRIAGSSHLRPPAHDTVCSSIDTRVIL